jgi:hypothetical protein
VTWRRTLQRIARPWNLPRRSQAAQHACAFAAAYAELRAVHCNVIQFHIMHRNRPSPLSLAAGAAERLMLAAGLTALLWAAVAWAVL